MHSSEQKEIKDLMEGARRRNILIMNGVNVSANKRELNRFREMEGESHRNVDQLGGESRTREGYGGVLGEHTLDDEEETEVIKNEN